MFLQWESSPQWTEQNAEIKNERTTDTNRNQDVKKDRSKERNKLHGQNEQHGRKKVRQRRTETVKQTECQTDQPTDLLTAIQKYRLMADILENMFKQEKVQ